MKILILFLLILHFTSISFSQFHEYPRQDHGQFMGGFGLTWIDKKPHYTFYLAPEASFDDFGVGLDLQLTFDSNAKLRKESFNDFSDYLSIIRYARYGLKNDPVFIKLGALDYYTLGHGSIMYLYNNSPSFDNRKSGLVMDIDFGSFGFESIYSSFAEASIFGIRGYVRPLHYTSLNIVPVIRNIELGATYAVDFHENSGITSGFYDTSTDQFETLADEGSINIIGLDAGLPIISSSFADVTLYYDFVKIIDFGSGSAVGVIAQFNPLGLVQAYAKLERRFNGDNYIPSYFNSFHEIERFRVDKSSGAFRSKARTLASLTDNDDGFYGELGVNVLGIFHILGSYQRLDKTPESGILHLSSEISPEDAPLLIRAGYDKINIRSEKDVFTLDDRSYLFTELGYKPYPFMVVSLVFNWTFTPVRDSGDNIIGYEPQKRIEPRVYFIFPFELGGD